MTRVLNKTDRLVFFMTAKQAQTGKGRRTPIGTRGEAPIASKAVVSVLFLTVFLDFLGFSIVLPYLYFQATSLGADDFAYGLLVTSFSLMQLVFVWVFGRLSDRVGRRKVLLVSLFGSGVSFVLFGLANTLWLLFAARIVGGITDSTFSVAQAYVADITTGRDRLKQMGLMGAGIGLGLIAGPALGGILSTLYGYAAPSFLAATLAFVNFALAFVRLPESRPAVHPKRQAEGFRGFLRTVTARKPLMYLLTATFTGNLAFVVMDVTLAPWLETAYGFGPLQTGLIFLYVGVVSVATQAAVLPRLGKRYSSASLLALGLAVTTVSFLGFGVDGFLPFALAMAALLMFGYGLVNPSLSHLISENADEGDQGGTLGLSQSIASLARVFAPSLGVTLFSLGINSGFIGTAFLAAAAINTTALVIIVSRRASLQTEPAVQTEASAVRADPAETRDGRESMPTAEGVAL